MRTIICTILLLSVVTIQAQRNVVGFYTDYHGYKLELRQDSSFEYTYRFDLYSTWTKGFWSVKKDTIYFRWVPVYDTVRIVSKNGKSKDSLILSRDKKPDRIDSLETGVLYAGGQNYYPYPQKLYYKRNRLYRLEENGQLRKKRVRGIWSKRKFPLWYRKVEKTDWDTHNLRFSKIAAMCYI